MESRDTRNNFASVLKPKRDQAVETIRTGKTKFMSARVLSEKVEGFQLFKAGLFELVNYAKTEPSPVVQNAVIAKAQELTKEAVQMKEQLKAKGFDVEKPTVKKVGVAMEGDKFKMMVLDMVVQEKPDIKWTDLAGQDTAIRSLQEAIILPIRFPQLFTGVRKPWSGILLYGPPGTGKTYLAKACATEVQATFFSISASDIMSKFVGDSERMIKALFQVARENKPSIIFIDEIDALGSARSDNDSEVTRRIKTELLVQMQGVGTDNTGLLILGATNLPWALDPALRRRFEKRIYIALPDKKTRHQLISKVVSKTEHVLSEKDMAEIAHQTEGFSPADVSILIRDALFMPVRKLQTCEYFMPVQKDGKTVFIPCYKKEKGCVKKNWMELGQDELAMPPLQLRDFEMALKGVKASVAKEDLKKFEEFTKNFGEEAA